MKLEEIMKKYGKKEKPAYGKPVKDYEPIRQPGYEDKQKEMDKWYPKAPEKGKEKPGYKPLEEKKEKPKYEI